MIIYYQTAIRAGKVLEIYKSYEKRIGKIEGEGCRERTKEEIDKCNYQNAVRKLTRLMNANFEDGDLHLVLTYPKDNKPTPQDAQRLYQNWYKAMGREFKKAGVMFKWIMVTEYKGKNIHHHVLVNNPDELNVIKIAQSRWKNGIVKSTPLYSDGQYKDLAEYFVKETDKTFRLDDGGMKRRWSSSRNLTKPTVTVKKKKSSSWRASPAIPKGFYMDSDTLVNGINPWSGKEYQKYSLIAIDDVDKRKPKPKKQKYKQKQVDNVHNSRKKSRKKE